MEIQIKSKPLKNTEKIEIWNQSNQPISYFFEYRSESVKPQQEDPPKIQKIQRLKLN